ncbi:MAG: DUF6034 family protein [Butyrivibrio sp.]|nr:DUF6034 family protein [Butyrivibrio sp.]
MNKKIYMCATAVLSAALLAGCGGKSEQSSADRTQSNLLYSDADESWEEEFDAVLENGGKVRVKIDAEIDKISVKTAVVTEAAEIEISREYKETVLKQIFGESEIYLYDMENIPEEQLRHHIVDLQYEAEVLSEEVELAYEQSEREKKQLELEALTKEIEEYRSCLDTAPEEYIVAEDMTGNAFAGYWNGMMYAVYFQSYLNENPKGHRSFLFNIVKPNEVSYPIRNQSIIIEPVDIREVAPGHMQYSAGVVKIYDNFDYERSEGCAAAQEIADRFIRNFGLNEVIYDYTRSDDSGKYMGGSGNLQWITADGYGETDGYYFNYSIALDTEKNIVAHEHDAVYNKWENYADAANPQYSRRSIMTVYVKGESVIYAEINNPLEVVSVNEGVKVLSFDIIKDIIRSELSDNIGNYTAYEAADGTAVSFQTMAFGYVRLRDAERGDLYSYVPAWRLIGRNSNSLEWGAENMLIINAVDGTPINVKDLI